MQGGGASSPLQICDILPSELAVQLEREKNPDDHTDSLAFDYMFKYEKILMNKEKFFELVDRNRQAILEHMEKEIAEQEQVLAATKARNN
jgi:hypothetical protein